MPLLVSFATSFKKLSMRSWGNNTLRTLPRTEKKYERTAMQGVARNKLLNQVTLNITYMIYMNRY